MIYFGVCDMWNPPTPTPTPHRKIPRMSNLKKLFQVSLTFSPSSSHVIIYSLYISRSNRKWRSSSTSSAPLRSHLLSSLVLLKDSEFFGIFYCFSNFGTILIIKRFRFYRNLLLFFEFRYYPYYYYYYYSFFFGHAIVIANLQNRITFSYQTPLIHGPLSDTLQRAFWCWSGLPFWI